MSRPKAMLKAFLAMPKTLMWAWIVFEVAMLFTPLWLGNWIVFAVAIIHICVVVWFLWVNANREYKRKRLSVAMATTKHILWLERFISGSKQDLEDWMHTYTELWEECGHAEAITYEALMDSHLVDMEEYHTNRRIEARIEVAEKSHTALMLALEGKCMYE